MYNIIKNVIKSRNYELSDILKKVDTLWVQGSISDEEKTELYDLARNNADFGKSVDVIKKLKEFESRLSALERNGENLTEYVVGKWYYNGDKITFEGKNYSCIAPEGVVCTWSPAEYPAYWEEI